MQNHVSAFGFVGAPVRGRTRVATGASFGAAARRIATFVLLVALGGGITFGTADASYDGLVPLCGFAAAACAFFAVRSARARGAADPRAD